MSGLVWVLLAGVLMAIVAFSLWARTPMDELNAEMIDRIETTRATLETLPDAPLEPRRPRRRA